MKEKETFQMSPLSPVVLESCVPPSRVGGFQNKEQNPTQCFWLQQEVLYLYVLAVVWIIIFFYGC